MAKIILKLNGTPLSLTADSYKDSYSAVDHVSQSEAGTTLRAVVRTGILSKSITYKCDSTEKALLDGFNKLSSLIATYYDEVAGRNKTWKCFMEGYSAELISEDATKRYYKVSFKLRDLSTDDEES